MDQGDTKEKLRVLLNHWVEHNIGHAREFTEWAEKSRQLGQGKVYHDIVQATRRMEEVNEFLLAALEELKEA